MQYDINGFVKKLRDIMYLLFPEENEDLKLAKHSTRPWHIKDIAFKRLPVKADTDGNIVTFDIGSTYAEEYYPYYHILQQAPVIRKRNKGDEKTMGSQAKITKNANRDYEKVAWNGKTFTKEYSKNVRGSRKSVVDNSTRYMYFGGQKIKINRSANSYENIHYQYIDNMLHVIAPEIANYFGLKLARVQNTGNEEEYGMQEESTYTTDIYETLESHNLGDEDYEDYGY